MAGGSMGGALKALGWSTGLLLCGTAAAGGVVLQTDSGGQVRFPEFLGSVPAVVLPIYARCPQTCSILAASWGKLSREYTGAPVRWVVLSFDPGDRPEDVRRFRQRWGLEQWIGVCGDSLAIAAVLRQLGIQVRPQPFGYDHPNVAAVVAPDGRVVRLILGVSPRLRDVQLSLLEARRGSTGLGILEGVFLRCFRYDPAAARYVVDWAFVAQLLSGVGLLVGMLVWWRWERKRGRR
jgi:protein SCO1/2